MSNKDEGAREALVERLAEAIFITEHGEFSEDYHPDHNRWTWQGDGHHENYKASFRTYARAVLPLVEAHAAAEVEAAVSVVRAEAPRIEINQPRNAPAECRVWIRDRLVFDGVSRSALLAPSPAEGTGEAGGEWVAEETHYGTIHRCRHCQGVNDWTGHRTDCPVYRAAVARSKAATTPAPMVTPSTQTDDKKQS